MVQHTVRKSVAGEIGARALANIAYGASRSIGGELLCLLFREFARAAEHRVCEFDAQALSNTAWAFATTKHLEKKLFTALAREAESQISKFKTQNLANTAWAFAAGKRPEEKLFTVLVRAAECRVGEFNA